MVQQNLKMTAKGDKFASLCTAECSLYELGGDYRQLANRMMKWGIIS